MEPISLGVSIVMSIGSLFGAGPGPVTCEYSPSSEVVSVRTLLDVSDSTREYTLYELDDGYAIYEGTWDDPSKFFEGSLAWDISLGKLLTGRVELASIELSEAKIRVRSDQMAGAEATPSESLSGTREQQAAKDLAPVQTPASVQSADAAQKALRLEAPLSVRIAALRLHQVQADVDGNVVEVGEFAADFSWTKDQVTVESLSLKDSSFLAAPSEPAKESVGVVLKRTFSQPVLPAVGAIDLPVDVNVEAFALD